MPSAETGVGDDVSRQPATFPYDVAGGQIVASNAIGTADDELRLAAVLDHDRCCPRRDLFPRDPPPLFAGPFVEGDHK